MKIIRANIRLRVISLASKHPFHINVLQLICKRENECMHRNSLKIDLRLYELFYK